MEEAQERSWLIKSKKRQHPQGSCQTIVSTLTLHQKQRAPHVATYGANGWTDIDEDVVPRGVVPPSTDLIQCHTREGRRPHSIA